MMKENLCLEKATWNDLQGLIAMYFAELNDQNDSFHNSLMFGAEARRILLDGETVGFYALGDSWTGGKMITAFYMCKGKRRWSAEIFAQILESDDVEAAIVPSNDAHLVSLAFETMNARGTTFDMQAYNYVYGAPERPAEYGRACFEEVMPDEYEKADALTEGQWEGCFGNPDFTFYAIRDKGETLGYGAIGKMQYNSRNVDVGNFTLPQHRRKGVGRSLIINLSEVAMEQGYVPVAGCWYGNKESIPTLASSGFLPENRLFYVKFK